MKELADKTAGMQIIVEDVSQIDTQLGNDLNVLLSVGDNGTFMFSDLLRKCHIPDVPKRCTTLPFVAQSVPTTPLRLFS